MLRGNEEEAVELWMQAKKISEKHFDSQVNLCMYRWQSGDWLDEELLEKFNEYVFTVKGKGQAL